MGRTTVALAGLSGLVVGLAGGMIVRPGASDASVVELHVPGAQSISVHCNGTTVNTDGTDVTFVAGEGACHVEAPLTAVMPLKGDLHVSMPGQYACARQNDHLECDRVR
jgi:hypothetical protein